jgi:hypothetical protein
MDNDVWSLTYSGKRIYLHPSFMVRNEYDIEDVAHHLSLLNRWAGATSEPMNVAQHSCIVSDLMGGSIEGLMHDAQEYMWHDITRPFKSIMPDYKDIEDAAQASMARYFGYVNPSKLPDVHHYDDMALAQEMRDICVPFETMYVFPKPPEEKLVPWDWKRSKGEFLDRWRMLVG